MKGLPEQKYDMIAFTIPIEEAMKFAEYFLANWEYMDDTSAGTLYARKDRPNDCEPCYTPREIYAEWKLTQQT